MIPGEDTIVASATALGEAAVAIVRVSGEQAYLIVNRVIRLASGHDIASVRTRTLVNAELVDQDGVVDQLLAVRFASPRSFTGEDVVELHLHGNPLVVDRALVLLTAAGARLALPGEFSRRAFLHGKMDLTQAEGLAGVISSESDMALRLAQRQLGGELRDRVAAFRSRFVQLLALLELELDFVEEDYEFTPRSELAEVIAELQEFAGGLVDSYRASNRIRRGPRILLLGLPNAGKSSLFNAMLGYGRSLVSPIPGTTRDYLEERVSHGGVVLHFLDTAGLRSTEDVIESAGVGRAEELISVSDQVLFLIDSADVDGRQSALDELRRLRSQYPDVAFHLVWTKIDARETDALDAFPEDGIPCSVFRPDLVRSVLDGVSAGFSTSISQTLVLVSQRQFELFSRMLRGLVEIDIHGVDTEILSVQLRSIVEPLNELSGASISEDVLNAVFSSFCIGK